MEAILPLKVSISAGARRVTHLRTVGRPSNGELGISDVNAITSASLIAILCGLAA
jgi:hypothetical protein